MMHRLILMIHNLCNITHKNTKITYDYYIIINSINDCRNSLTVLSQFLLQVLSLSFQTLTAHK